MNIIINSNRLFLYSLFNIKTITPIEGTNGKFEYYEYNDDLKLIHSVEDDMFQAKSIIDSLGSNKEANKWLVNKDTKELIEGFKNSMTQNSASYSKLIDDKEKFNNIKFIKGIYIHRLLVNNFATWANIKYAYKIAILLDDKFEVERLRKENKDKQDKIDELMKKADYIIERNEELHKEVVGKIEENTELTKHNNNLLKRCDGLIVSENSKGKIPLMIYADIKNKKFDINDKLSYKLHFHISRAQILNMKRPDAIKAYRNGDYFILIMLPASILVNVDVINNLKTSKFNDYLIFHGTTDMYVCIDKLLLSLYGYKRFNRIINGEHSERYVYNHNVEG